MTTRITIDAHAGWDVEVELEQLNAEGEVTSRTKQVVSKYTIRDIYVHSHLRVSGITELRTETK